MDDVGKRRRANRRSCVVTERDAGLEVARKWSKEDHKYRALLRIAKATAAPSQPRQFAASSALRVGG